MHSCIIVYNVYDGAHCTAYVLIPAAEFWMSWQWERDYLSLMPESKEL